MQVSVIIPCYNCAKTLEEACKSVADQADADIEMVLIDDGSTDSTAVTIERIAGHDRRVVPIFNRKNLGVSATRNRGIDAATGSFIFFLDADDVLQPDCIKILIDAVTSDDIDFVRAKHHWWLPETGAVSVNPEEELNFVEVRNVPPAAYPQIVNIFSCWNALIRTALVKENGIRFPEDMRLGEDRHFNMRVFEVARKITLLNDYTYRWRKGADHTQQATKVLVADPIFAMQNALAFLQLAERPWFVANPRHQLYLRTIVLIEVVSRLTGFSRQLDAKTFPEAASAAISAIFARMRPDDVNLGLPCIKGRSEVFVPLYEMAQASLGAAIGDEFYATLLKELGRIRLSLSAQSQSGPKAPEGARHVLYAALQAALSRRSAADLDQELTMLRRCGLIDPSFYRTEYPDVAEARMDEALHYHRHGFAELRNPNDWFDTRSYLEKYPELVLSGTNPLFHFAIRSHALMGAKS